MEKLVTRTADDETPICSRCDNNDIGDEFCLSKCGAKHGWGGYERAEFIESEDDAE